MYRTTAASNELDAHNDSMYNENSQYRTMWTIEDGVLSKKEVAAFYSKISELNNNYRNYRVSAEGDYIFEVGNKIIYTDGVYDYPMITRVISVDNVDEDVLVYARRMVYDGEENGTEFYTTKEIIEAVSGEGTVLRTDCEDSAAFNRYGGFGKRTDSSEIVRGSGKNVKFSFSTPVEEKAETQAIPQQIEAEVPQVQNNSSTDFTPAPAAFESGTVG